MKTFSKYILTFLYIIVILILLLDVYRSGRTSLTYLHISSRQIEMWSIIIFILSRIYIPISLPSFFSKLNTYIILPITLVIGISLTVWTYFTPPNYVYAITQIQSTQVVFIAIFASITWLLNHNNQWFKKYYTRILFLGSLAYLATAFIVSLFPRDIFVRFSKEDKLVENMQVIILALGTFWAIKIVKKLYKQKDKINAGIFASIAVALFFIAGDEISWGQRIFHLATPSSLSAINTQQEITVHNLNFIGGYVGLSYILIGFIGTYAWIVKYFIPRLKKIPFDYYIPPWFCCIFYFTGFTYNFYAVTNYTTVIRVWSESAELMLYSGISFTILTTLLHLKKNN